MYKPRIRFRHGRWDTDFFPYVTWLKLSPTEKRNLDMARRHVLKLNEQRKASRSKRQRKEKK